ncbi:MAG: putative surface protein with fasciclin (FAS1) repeats [Cryomorphaceae bacterium]|jgi:uncharacterized surface protein with fasciclin (FAS1) repeats
MVTSPTRSAYKLIVNVLVQVNEVKQTDRTMNNIKIFSQSLILVITVLFSFNAIADGHGPKGHSKDIVDTAVAAGSFNTLALALTEAGLIETLKGEGPFTVFAPTDEAFAKIPADQLQAILADKELLTSILTYHVVAGKVTAADVVKLTSAATVQGSEVMISTKDGVKVNEANVVKTDIMTSNGIIHVIDTVLLPST